MSGTPYGTLGNVDSVNVDGLASYIPKNGSLIMLGATMVGNALCSTLRNFSNPANSNSGYTPSGSNKFYCIGLEVHAVSGGANPDTRLGYGDTDVGLNSSSLPTTPWGIGHGSIANLAAAANMLNYTPAAAQATGQYYAREKLGLYIPFPNGKYPLVLWNGNLSAGTGILLYGYEAL